MSWRSRSPDETRALARALAKGTDPEGGVVTLQGPLGAGKTVFAKGLAEGLGLRAASLASPTFVLASEVDTPAGLRLVHADFYRVEDEAELEAAGLADWLAPRTLLVVEWGDRFPDALPEDRLEITIAPVAGDSDARRIGARAGGPRSAAWCRRWSAAWP